MGPFRDHQSSHCFTNVIVCDYVNSTLTIWEFHPQTVVKRGKLFTSIRVSQAYMKAFNSHHKPTVPTFRQGKRWRQLRQCGNWTVLFHIKGSFLIGTLTQHAFSSFPPPPQTLSFMKVSDLLAVFSYFPWSNNPRTKSPLSCLKLPKVPLSSSVSSSIKWDDLT